MLASPSSNSNLDKRAKEFEKKIDELDKKLPELNNFILPGGGIAGSYLHLCKNSCKKDGKKNR